MEIFTLGHSNYSIERLLHMLKHFNINCLVDIRGTPYSKYNVHFDKERLQKSITDAGFIYIYMGVELAAKRVRKVSYNEEGYSDFDLVVKEEEFVSGVERLKNGCKKGYRIALLGAMQEPIRCHRAILVGKALREEGFHVNHILDDYTIVTQEDIDNMVLEKYFPDRNQITIDTLLGNEKSNEELIEEGYKLANRDIGYRIEHIQK